VRDGAPSGRGVVVALERLLIRDERVEVRRETLGEVTVTPGEAGEATIPGLRLPDDAFTFDGAQLALRWSVTAREVGGEPAARVALDVHPPVRRVEDCVAASRSTQLARAKRRAKEAMGLVVPGLVVLFCAALAVFGLVVPGLSIGVRLGALLPLVVAGMFLSWVIWPVLRRWRALARGPKLAQDVVLCGARLSVPAPQDRPSWRHVLVERSENSFKGRTSSRSTFTGTRVEEKEQLLAEGQGPAPLTLSPFGPPTFSEAGLTIEHELRFFHPDRPDDVVVTQLTVAPGRVA
ncbi:MAG: hypothetical protein RIT28_4252, partial [Pseudomonadota bacterium]